MKHSHPARAWLASLGSTSPLWDAADRWYRTPRRYYHNALHANDVALNVLQLGYNLPEMLLAARWHDAVYVPGAPEGVNEQASAAALQHTARVKKMDSEAMLIVEKACDLIVQTRMSVHMSKHRITHPLTDALLDADLAGMAYSYGTFVAAQRRIVREQTGVLASSDSMAKAAVWLASFAARRKYIFHTDTARSLWEANSRDNIARFTLDHNSKK